MGAQTTNGTIDGVSEGILVETLERQMNRRRGSLRPEETEHALDRLSADARKAVATVVAKHHNPVELRRAFARGAARTEGETRDALVVLGASDYDALRRALDPRTDEEIARDLFYAVLRSRRRKGVSEQMLDDATKRIGREEVLLITQQGGQFSRQLANRAAKAGDRATVRALATLGAAGPSRAEGKALGGVLRTGPERRPMERGELLEALGLQGA